MSSPLAAHHVVGTVLPPVVEICRLIKGAEILEYNDASGSHIAFYRQILASR